MQNKILLAMMLMVATTAMAQTEEPDEFVLETIRKAEAGDPKEQCALGGFYEYGLGVPEDEKEAFKWFLKSAEGGDPQGMRNAGAYLMKGTVVKQDVEKGSYYLKKSGDAGDNKAYYTLGSYYWEGKYVEKNLETAFKYFIISARQGLKEAQYIVGRMYLMGDGVEKNLREAEKWYVKSAEAGNLQAQSQLGTLYKEDTELKDYAKALKWNTKAAEVNYPRSVRELGMQYFFGLGVSKNTAHGIGLFERAARLKDLKAMSYLGYFAMTGQGMAKDREKARQWFQKALAIDPNFEDAQVYLFALDHNLDAESADQLQKLIPNRQQEKNDIYAVVIGNEQYKNEAEVRFAENDATAFKDYLVNNLGVDETSQLKFILNAGLNDMLIALDWLGNAIKANDGQARAVFYYAGHGIPNESDRSAYLLPVDGIGTMPRSALSLKEFYESMGQLNARSVTVFLDACFSGSKREDGMLASARGVAIKAKQDDPQGKMVVFSAAQGDETAYPLDEQKHGLFTYYLLKKLQDSDGSVTYGELSDYLKDEVSRQAFKMNGKMQTPTARSSVGLGESWRTLSFK